MSIILNDKKIEIPGLNINSYKDGVSWIKHITDFSNRNVTIRLGVIHTHHGTLGHVIPGIGPNSTIDEALARYQVNTTRNVSWDFTIDFNGDIACQSDVCKTCAWQAGDTLINGESFGFEMVQKENGDLYEGQIEKVVLFIDAMTALLGIQRQIPWDSTKNKPKVGTIKRLLEGGKDCVGFIGHRNCSTQRGPGDPGDAIFLALRDAGYECFDFDKKEDLKVWKDRQKNILVFEKKDCDGIALKKTVEALKNKGYVNGMWVSRPIDQELANLLG